MTTSHKSTSPSIADNRRFSLLKKFTEGARGISYETIDQIVGVEMKDAYLPPAEMELWLIADNLIKQLSVDLRSRISMILERKENLMCKMVPEKLRTQEDVEKVKLIDLETDQEVDVNSRWKAERADLRTELDSILYIIFQSKSVSELKSDMGPPKVPAPVMSQNNANRNQPIVVEVQPNDNSA
jgi:hypothetical protein